MLSAPTVAVVKLVGANDFFRAAQQHLSFAVEDTMIEFRPSQRPYAEHDFSLSSCPEGFCLALEDHVLCGFVR